VFPVIRTRPHAPSVRRDVTSSSVVHLLPQGSMLGPILFILYTTDLVALIARFGLSPHLFADDTQIFGACSPADVDVFLLNVNECLSAVADWMDYNRLQNNGNNEFLWCTTSRRHHRLPAAGPTIGSSHSKPSSVAYDLGVFINADLSLQTRMLTRLSRVVFQYVTSALSCAVFDGRYRLLFSSHWSLR